MNLEDFFPLIAALEKAGLPILASVIQSAVKPYAGPFSGLATTVVTGLLPVINRAIGIDVNSTPDVPAVYIAENPKTSKQKLEPVQEDHQYLLDVFKESNAYALASQEQQVSIDTIEAQNPSLFVGGWRPFLGWGLSVTLIFTAWLPIIGWLFSNIGVKLYAVPEMPQNLFWVLCGLLGLNSGLRTVEKTTGSDSPKVGGVSTKTVTKAR